MKIAILTHQLGANYGGILQNWALQHVLKTFGHNPVTIKWAHEQFSWRAYFKSLLAVSYRRMNGMRLEWPHSPRWKNPDLQGLLSFVSREISCTNLMLLEKTPKYVRRNKFDAVIVGSDQVWRPLYIHAVEYMFLPFDGGALKKIAYAASFGTDDWEFESAQTSECKKWLNTFNAVSVREKSAVSICTEKFGYQKAELVLDPTMLLTAHDYMRLCKSFAPDKTGYVLVYVLDYNQELDHYATRLAKEKGLPLKVITGQIQSTDTIENWLASFRDAKYVITDSFHGTVFSIIFNRPFITFGNEGRGNARFDTLAHLFGIDKRRKGQNIDNPLKWEKINSTLQEYRNASITFLRESLMN